MLIIINGKASSISFMIVTYIMCQSFENFFDLEEIFVKNISFKIKSFVGFNFKSLDYLDILFFWLLHVIGNYV